MTLSISTFFDLAKSPGFKDGWDVSNKAWAHMVLHQPVGEGGFGVTFNDFTKDAAFYTTASHFVAWFGVFSQERQELWRSVHRLSHRLT